MREDGERTLGDLKGWTCEPMSLPPEAKRGRQRRRPPQANRVVPYDDAWPLVFEQIRSKLAAELDGLPVSIEHVGSTAVPGMAAKPIVDVDVVVPTTHHVAPVIERLRSAGYIHQGDLGIAGREAFDAPTVLPYHHLYVVVEGSRPHQDHVLLRDFLRRHPDRAAGYSRRKLDVAQLITEQGRRAYLEAKMGVVEAILEDARQDRRRSNAERA